MFKKLTHYALVLATSLIFIQSSYACTTQTVLINGKMTVCTTCGTITSCMQFAMKNAINIGSLFLIHDAPDPVKEGFWYGTGKRLGQLFRLYRSSISPILTQNRQSTHNKFIANTRVDYSQYELPAVYRKWRLDSIDDDRLRHARPITRR